MQQANSFNCHIILNIQMNTRRTIFFFFFFNIPLTLRPKLNSSLSRAAPQVLKKIKVCLHNLHVETTQGHKDSFIWRLHLFALKVFILNLNTGTIFCREIINVNIHYTHPFSTAYMAVKSRIWKIIKLHLCLL